MKPLNIVFFGTPEFAKTSLEAIHISPHKIAGVVTVPDKASGRGQKIQQSPVKMYAEQQRLPIFQPEKLKDPEFLQQMKSLNADVFVVVAFRMMPQVLFEIPSLGTFNLHASLLPDYRGAAPINYAVINGEETTGLTTFFINEKIDEGSILLQETVSILPDENAGSLHDRLMHKGAELVVKTLNGLSQETLSAIPQPEALQPKNAFKIFKEDTRIQWDQETDKVYNFIRGMSPHPCAFTILKIGEEEKQLKIYSGRKELVSHSHAPATLEISKTTFKIYTQDGIYYPDEVQLEGKKRMQTKDFLNGFQKYDHIHLLPTP